jgi:hypothetical protein
MEKEKIEQVPEFFPQEIVEQFKDLIRTEWPISIDKIPLTIENAEILISARMYLEETQRMAEEIMSAFKKEWERKGIDTSEMDTEIKIYPTRGFLENGRLFIFWTNCSAEPEAIQKAIEERKKAGQEIRISYPLPPLKLPETVGIYRELTLEETKKSLKNGRDEILRQLEERKFKELGINPEEIE